MFPVPTQPEGPIMEHRGDGPGQADSSPAVPVAAVLGYFVLTTALVTSFGRPNLPSLLLLVLLLPALVIVSRRRWSHEAWRRAGRLLPFAFRCVIALFFVVSCAFTLGLSCGRGAAAAPPAVGLLLLGALQATYFLPARLRPRWVFPAVLAVCGYLGAWQIAFVPRPSFDVLILQQAADGFLLAGQNPYASEYPPTEDSFLYGPAFVSDGRWQTFPYPPLQLLLTLPGYLLGDVRWAMLAAMLGAAALMAALGRKGGESRDELPELAAVLFLCNPLNCVILDRGWTEPILCLASAASFWAAGRRRGGVLAAALAAIVGIKQYGFLMTVPLWAARRLTWRVALGAVALAFITVLPFLMWDPSAFWRGVVRGHAEAAMRTDSLSVVVAVATYTGYQPPGVLGFAAAPAVGFAAFVRRSPSLAQAAVGGAAVLLAFFLFGKAGHMNYYWLAASLLPMAVAVSAGDASPGKTGGASTRPSVELGQV
jgi:Glycosyltransferase family 87